MTKRMIDKLPKATMTLNLLQREMDALEELAKAKGMTKTGIMRQALRMYQSTDVRIQRGERMKWVDKDGKSTEIISLGCGWEGMS